MKIIKLSQIEDRALMSVEDIEDWCLDNKVDIIVNDFGSNMEFAIDDLTYVWNEIKDL